jgi:hypothetical protein
MKTLASWAPAPDLNVTAGEPGELARIISVDRRDAEPEQGYACCPVCGTQSSSRHSSYMRMLRSSALNAPASVKARCPPSVNAPSQKRANGESKLSGRSLDCSSYAIHVAIG